MDSSEAIINKKIMYTIVFIVFILLATIFFRKILLGTNSLISLPRSDLTSGVISQNLETTGGKETFPIEGLDYTINNVQYFSGDAWILETLKPINNSSISGVVLLEKQNNYYEAVLGPGTSFDINDLESLPSPIKQYFINQGLTYEPVYQ